MIRNYETVRRRAQIGAVAFVLPILICASPIGLSRAAVQSGGSATPVRKPVGPSDYAKWENLGTATFSDDGQWLAVPVSRVDGTGDLQIHQTSGSPAAGPVPPAFKAPEGREPRFSHDSKWLAYRIGYSESEREKLQDEKKPVRDKLGLVSLEGDWKDAKAEVIAEVARFAFSEGGPYLAVHRYAPENSKRKGADLMVREMSSGKTATFGNVSEFAWQERGTLLAFLIDAEGKVGNGVQLYNAKSGTLHVLDSGEADFAGLSWRKRDDDLAVFRTKKDEAYEEPTHLVLAWQDLSGHDNDNSRKPQTYDHASDTSFPSGMRVVSYRRLRWSENGKTLFFGIQKWEPKPAADKRSEAQPQGEPRTEGPAGSAKPKAATVEVWHSRDERVIPMQRVEKERDREKNFLGAWHLEENRFVRLASDPEENFTILEGDRFGVETDRKAYQFENMFDRPRHDMVLVDLKSGDRKKVIEDVWYFEGGSATGKYLLYFKDDQYWTYDIARDRHTPATRGLRASWVNSDYDTPVRKQKPPWGDAGWLKEDQAFLVYDKYDLWAVAPDGSGGVRWTRGAEDQVRHRYARLDQEEEYIDPDKPVYLSLYGEWTKKHGYARIVGPIAVKKSPAAPDRLVWLDKHVGRLIRAKNTDSFAYVTQGFDDSPDYFAARESLAHARQVTETNPFQKDFAWGRSKLVEYKSGQGERLQGALYYPADYDANRKYPMIVYVYEKLSQNAHNYVVPTERSAYNIGVFTAQGYFVLTPDIVFRPRDPGLSAVECVVPAVQKVLEAGMVDPKRVGLVGHSWGGYEASFIPTQTNIFAASVAGAPLTNFFSMFGTVHWNQGLPETQHFETGQARMDVPYWVDMEAYVRNSPVMFIQQLETPMLVFFGDKDGTVDWHQGVEMYNYARRAGKMLVMLVYLGENHSAREKPNQIDYHRRVLQWFGHYLKGEPAEDWIARGLTVLEREKEVKRQTQTP